MTRLEEEFRWIADVAGRKLHLLERSASPEPYQQMERARIIEEARIFAAVAAESAVRDLPNLAPSRPGSLSAQQSRPDERRAPSTGPIGTLTDEAPDADDLHALLAFLVRQEPRVGWAVGVGNEKVVVATDVAYGWFPPRIAIPAGVTLPNPSATQRGTAAELLGDVTRSVEYVPGGPIPPSEGIVKATSTRAREAPAPADLILRVADLCQRRSSVPSAVRSLARAAGSGTVVEKGLLAIYAHVDATRHQLLSDYPLIDAVVLGDCMLLAAIEGCVTADLESASYHYDWFCAVASDALK